MEKGNVCEALVKILMVETYMARTEEITWYCGRSIFFGFANMFLQTIFLVFRGENPASSTEIAPPPHSFGLGGVVWEQTSPHQYFALF